MNDIDGLIGEAWAGDVPNGSHINAVLAHRGSATAASIVTAFTAPSKGHAPVLVCLGGGTPVWPPTVMMNKATAETEAQERMTWGAAQLGIGQGVLDIVAEGRIAGDGETVILIAVWVDPAASDATAVRVANREATAAAIRKALDGPAPGEVDALLSSRDTRTNGFYDGD